MAKKKAARARVVRTSRVPGAMRTLPPELWAVIAEVIERWRSRCWHSYHLIEIVDACPRPETLRVREGDWVCWVNKDSAARDIKFDSGFWPFEGTPAKIPVPGCSPSAWYKIRAGSKSKSYGYKPAGCLGPPGGPDIFVE